MKKLVHPRPVDGSAKRGGFGGRFDIIIVLLLMSVTVMVWPRLTATAWEGDSDLPEPDIRSALISTMGVEGVYYIHYNGSRLLAKPADKDAPLVVRIVDIVEEGDATVYELRYVSSQAGEFDLRDYLVAVDGQFVGPLLPARVTIRELLMPDHDGSLWQLPEPKIVPPIRYKLVLVMMATIWMIPIEWLLLKRTCSATNESRDVKPTLVEQ